MVVAATSVRTGPTACCAGAAGAAASGARRATAATAATAGSTRWTVAVLLALVSGTAPAREDVAGATGVTRGPLGTTARWTIPVPIPVPVRRAAGAGSASSGAGTATGRVSEGSSSPATGPAEAVSTPLTSPPGASSSTAWESVPANEWFCRAARVPPKPASATGPEAGPVALTRWIGGRPAHSARATGRGG